MEQESSQSQKMESSPASPTRVCSTSPARISSSSPARVSLADISNVSSRRPEPEESDLRKQIHALQQRLAEYERGGNSAACMVPHHQPFPAQGLSYLMSWATSPPPYGHFFPSPFRFYPHFMPAPSPFETPRTMMLSVPELDDEVDFDGVFRNYDNPSPLKLRRDIVEDCWRRACSHSNFGVLLVKKCYSERERAESNCTGDRRKKALSPKRLKAVKEAIASVQPPLPGQKEEERWKQYKDAINSSCRSITRWPKTRPCLF